MSATSDQDGLSDEDVAALYRWLLGRKPESTDTVQAFRAYYPNMGTGRRAVFESEEFRRFYEDVTGHAPAPREDAPSVLAQAFLRRAGGMGRPGGAVAQPELRQGMRTMLQQLGGASLTLVLGGQDIDLADLIPLAGAETAILHVAPDFPAFVPHMGRIDQATIFRIALDGRGLLAMLNETNLPIGLLLHLGAPGDDALLAAIRPCLAPRCIIAVGPGMSGAELAGGWAGAEALPPWLGYSMFHIGGWHLPVAYALTHAACRLPDADEYPALAIACIARNERASIANMLRSALPVASFVAVLDTGSDDDTLEEARAVLAECGKPFVLERLVLERFDDMRNTALGLVPDWVAWILMLDADEALAPEDFLPLLTLLRHAEADAYALPRYNYIGIDMKGAVTPYPDRQIRLLRNTGPAGPRYEGAVHETVRNVPAAPLPLDASALGLPRGGPHIHHLVRRFRTPEEEARKQAYYKDLAARLG
jgi:hypothetical protein